MTTCCPTTPYSDFHYPVPNTVPKPGMGGKGAEKEEGKPQVLSNSRLLPFRHKEIKHMNEDYFPNIALFYLLPARSSSSK